MPREPFNIEDVDMKELSLVFKKHGGKEFAPVNKNARVLAVKAQAKNIFSNIVKAFTGKGDTQDDMNELAAQSTMSGLVGQLTDALFSIFSVADSFPPDQVKAAVAAVMKEFAGEFADLIGTGSAKAFTKDQRSKLRAVKQAHQDLGAKLDDMSETMDDEDDDDDEGKGQNKAEPYLVGEDGLPTGWMGDRPFTEAEIETLKAAKEPYGDVEYADPGYQKDGKKRYPLDNEEHVRAAARFFGKPKNRDKYSAEQISRIQSKIDAAKKKFGIGDDDEDGKKAVTVVADDEIKATVKALSDKFDAALDVANKNREAAEAQAEAVRLQANVVVGEATRKANEAIAQAAELATKVASLEKAQVTQVKSKSSGAGGITNVSTTGESETQPKPIETKAQGASATEQAVLDALHGKRDITQRHVALDPRITVF